MNAEFKLGLGLDKDGRIAESLSDLVGNTPMLSLKGYCEKHGVVSELVAKLEYFNPCGSSKDRVAKNILSAAASQGKLNGDTVIVEPTSGNMGIGLAFLCAAEGRRLILTMPDNMSEERMKLLRALGAELDLTPAAQGMQGAIDRARAICEATENCFMPDQFANPANPDAHRKTTGPEILRDCYGKIEYFVAGVGSGGTITGVGEVLKAYRKKIRVIAVEPAGSPVLSGGEKGAHGIMGIGAGFVPEVLNRDIIDEIIPVTDADAIAAAREVAETDGLLVGISSGAALHAAKMIALRANDPHARIVVLLPDGGERYLSTPLFSE